MNWNLVIFNKMDTMKKIYYIILGLLVGLVACQENDKTDFDSNGAVYFQVNQGSWSDTRDSIVYSFARKDGERTGQPDGGGRELRTSCSGGC